MARKTPWFHTIAVVVMLLTRLRACRAFALPLPPAMRRPANGGGGGGGAIRHVVPRRTTVDRNWRGHWNWSRSCIRHPAAGRLQPLSLSRAFRTGRPTSSLGASPSSPPAPGNGNGAASDGAAAETAPPLPPPPMEHLYQEWSIEQDQLLWSNRARPAEEVASLLGRGVRGVQARLEKLGDVSSPAYTRLFVRPNNRRGDKKGSVARNGGGDDDDAAAGGGRGKNGPPPVPADDNPTPRRLVPVSEVLRRIEFDPSLDSSDFSVLHYDRLDGRVVKSPWDAPNRSVSNTKETSLVKALPEHRIVGVLYRERLVWDRPGRADLVFGEPGIANVVATYPEWKREQDELAMAAHKRLEAVTARLERMLGGGGRFEELKRLSEGLLQEGGNDDDDESGVAALPPKRKVEEYVRRTLELFRAARTDGEADAAAAVEDSTSDLYSVPTTDRSALDEVSEFVSCWFQEDGLREAVLDEVAYLADRLDGDSFDRAGPVRGGAAAASPSSSSGGVTVVELSDADLEESFVRGSGPGGQKVNKTSNRVVLVHTPTGLRVECQDTRSLQQNRKIARRRLLEKLDDHVNGSRSKVRMGQKRAAEKRQKSKSKNRARQRKRQEEKLSQRPGGDGLAEDEIENEDEDEDDTERF